MNVEKAVEKLKALVDNPKIKGYWQRGSSYIFSLIPEDDKIKMCTYYIVYANGKIMPTNPAKSALRVEDMKQIKGGDG